jgi:hypothetical protein
MKINWEASVTGSTAAFRKLNFSGMAVSLVLAPSARRPGPRNNSFGRFRRATPFYT